MRFVLIALAAAALLAPAAGQAEETAASLAVPNPNEPVSGRIQSHGATTEILGEPPAVGVTIQLPNGWYRIESGPEPDESAGTGSFSVVKTEAIAAAPPTTTPPPPPALAPPPTIEPLPVQPVPVAAAETRCYAEKERYVSELFRIAGIWYFEHPLDLLEALEETPGLSLSPWVRFNLFGLAAGGPLFDGVGVQPVRPVGWDNDLRWVAEDLIACIRESRQIAQQGGSSSAY